MLEKISLIRHGDKIPSQEDPSSVIQKDLEQLSEEDRKEWEEAVSRLGIEMNPEIRPSNILNIRKAAESFVSQLPARCLILIGNTLTPRTKLTADLLSTELYNEALKTGKEIAVSFLWEADMRGKDETSSLRIPNGPQNGEALAKSLLAEMNPDVDSGEYLKTGGAFKIINEDLLISKMIEADLRNAEDSEIRKRVGRYEEQIKNLKSVSSEDEKVFYIGVGHHMSLVSLDMYMKGVREYTVDEMPQPLDMWSYDASKDEK